MYIHEWGRRSAGIPVWAGELACTNMNEAGGGSLGQLEGTQWHGSGLTGEGVTSAGGRESEDCARERGGVHVQTCLG